MTTYYAVESGIPVPTDGRKRRTSRKAAPAVRPEEAVRLEMAEEIAVFLEVEQCQHTADLIRRQFAGCVAA
jgi:hypothetical protein